jgi:hypothetical protein
MRKEDLRLAVAETRQREAELEAMCTDAPADPSGKWQAKDHLAHMAYFRGRDAQLIDAVRAGKERPEGMNSDELYAATRDQTSADVIAGARRSWDSYVAAIEACTDEDLERTRPDRPERKLVESPADHLSAHLMWAHLDAGDEKAAEAAVRWAWQLGSRVSDDPRSNAVGAYNVACFYARTGRVDDALPLLREGLEGAPDLKEWAPKDPDLDPIRQDPRVVELLAQYA